MGPSHAIRSIIAPRILFVKQVDHIHAAGVRDVIIDHDHLAMLARTISVKKHKHQIDFKASTTNTGITH